MLGRVLGSHGASVHTCPGDHLVNMQANSPPGTANFGWFLEASSDLRPSTPQSVSLEKYIQKHKIYFSAATKNRTGYLA